MKKWALLLVLSGCGLMNSKQDEKIQKAHLPAALTKTEACFVLYDLKQGKIVEMINQEHCLKRLPACSTFKVPLSVMAFDQNILKGPDSAPYKWDKVQRMIPGWNKEQTAKSWMQESVVWFSQRLTKQMGRKKVQDYLEKFSYGNQDFSGGIEDAWLTPAPFLKMQGRPTVLVSAIEQIDFLKSLYRLKLPVSMSAMVQTRALLSTETSPKGSVIAGKTGSGFIGEKADQRLGWYVAHLQTSEGEYLSVMTFNDLVPQANSTFGGALARESMKEILMQKGLW